MDENKLQVFTKEQSQLILTLLVPYRKRLEKLQQNVLETNPEHEIMKFLNNELATIAQIEGILQ